jgi:hypothetical protein
MVWDRPDIDGLLNANPDVAQSIQDAATARDLSGLFAGAGLAPAAASASRVAEELAAIPRGHAGLADGSAPGLESVEHDVQVSGPLIRRGL